MANLFLGIDIGTSSVKSGIFDEKGHLCSISIQNYQFSNHRADWLEKEKISLRGFVSKKRYTLKTNPEEFFTTNADGLKPVLYPWE